MQEGNPIYKFMKDNGLTQKDEATFISEYSSPEKAQELYSFMTKNNLTQKDSATFYDEYFGPSIKKKSETLSNGSTKVAAQPTAPSAPSGTGTDNAAKSAKIKELQTRYTTLVAQGQKDGWTPSQMEEYTRDVKSEIESFMPKRDVGPYRLPTDKEKTSFAFRQQTKENDRQAGLNVPEYDLKGNETELQAMFRNNDYKEAKAQSDKLANIDRHTDSEQYAALSSKFDQTLKNYQSGKATKEDLRTAQTEFDLATNGAVVDYISTNSVEPQKDLVKYANILDRKKKGEKVLDTELKYVLDMQKNAASQLANEAFTQMYESEQSGDTDIYFEGLNRINAKIEGLNKAGGVSEEAANNIQKEIDDLSNQTNVSQETIAKLTDSADKLKNISGAINSIEQLNNEASSSEQTDRIIESEKVEYAKENPIKATALEFGKQIVGTMGKGLLSIGQLPAIYDKDSASYNSNDFISSAIEGAKSNPTFTPISKDAPSYVKLAGELGGAVGSIAMFATGGSSRLATSAIAFLTSEADAYKEAKDLGMNDSDARLYSTFFSMATAASEGIIKDSDYLTKNAKASVLRAFRGGKTMKESIELATKEIPKSLETYLETSGKEGLEEGVSSMVGTITQGLSNEALGKKYYEGFKEENLKHDILLGAAAGGFMHTIRGRKGLSPVQESVLLDMTENAESIQSEIAKTDPNVAKAMNDALEASKQALDALKSHSGWNNLDKTEQAHALALTQQIAAIEEEQKKIGSVRLEDKAKDEEIKKIQEELNSLFNEKKAAKDKEGAKGSNVSESVTEGQAEIVTVVNENSPTVVEESSALTLNQNLTSEKTETTKTEANVEQNSQIADLVSENISGNSIQAKAWRSAANQDDPQVHATLVQEITDQIKDNEAKVREIVGDDVVDRILQSKKETPANATKVNEIEQESSIVSNNISDQDVSLTNEGNKVESVDTTSEKATEKVVDAPLVSKNDGGNNVGKGLPKLINEGWDKITPNKTVQVSEPKTVNIKDLKGSEQKVSIRKAANNVKKGGKPYIIDFSTNNSWQHNKYLLTDPSKRYGYIEADGENVIVTPFKIGDKFLQLKTEYEQSIKELPKAQTKNDGGNSVVGDVKYAKDWEGKTYMEKRQAIINELPKKKVNYNEIKGGGVLSAVFNNPQILNSTVFKSAKKIYEDIIKGEPIRDTPYVNENMRLLDGINRVNAQVAAGIKDIEVVVMDNAAYDYISKRMEELNKKYGSIYKSEQFLKEQPKAETKVDGGNSVGGGAVEPKKQNFTQFAKENGYPDDYDTSFQAQLLGGRGLEGRRQSNRSIKEQDDAFQEMQNKKAEGKKAYEQAILDGKVIDPDGKLTREGILKRDYDFYKKELESKIANAESGIKNINRLGKMAHLDNGKLKKGYQRTVDDYNEAITKHKETLDKLKTEYEQFPKELPKAQTKNDGGNSVGGEVLSTKVSEIKSENTIEVDRNVDRKDEEVLGSKDFKIEFRNDVELQSDAKKEFAKEKGIENFSDVPEGEREKMQKEFAGYIEQYKKNHQTKVDKSKADNKTKFNKLPIEQQRAIFHDYRRKNASSDYTIGHMIADGLLDYTAKKSGKSYGKVKGAEMSSNQIPVSVKWEFGKLNGELETSYPNLRHSKEEYIGRAIFNAIETKYDDLGVPKETKKAVEQSIKELPKAETPSSTEKPNISKEAGVEDGGKDKVREEWDKRIESIDTDKEYTDISQLKIGDVVLTKNGNLGFVKKINPKNVIYETTYNKNGETVLMDLQVSKADIQVFKKPKAETPTDKPSDKWRKKADELRKGTGGTSFILPKLLAEALDIAANVYDTTEDVGKKMNKAIKAALAHIKDSDWYKNLSKEEKATVVDEAIEAVEGAVANPKAEEELSKIEGERRQTSRSKRIEEQQDFKDKLEDYTRTYTSVNTKAIIPLAQKYFDSIKQRIANGEKIETVFGELYEYLEGLIAEDSKSVKGEVNNNPLNKSAFAIFVAQAALSYSIQVGNSKEATDWNNFLGAKGKHGGTIAALQNAGVSLDPLLNRLQSEDAGRKDFLSQVINGTMTVGEAIKELAEVSKLTKDELGTILDIKTPKRATHPTTQRQKFKKEREDIMAKVRAKMQLSSFGPMNAIPEILELANSYLKEGVYTMNKVKEKVWNDFKELFPDGQEDLNKVLDDNAKKFEAGFKANKAKTETSKKIVAFGRMMSEGLPMVDKEKVSKVEKLKKLAELLDIELGGDSFSKIVDDFIGVTEDEKINNEKVRATVQFGKLLSEPIPKEKTERKTKVEKLKELANKLDGEIGGSSFSEQVKQYENEIAKELATKEKNKIVADFGKLLSEPIPKEKTERKTKEKMLLDMAKELDSIYGGTYFSTQVDGYLEIKSTAKKTAEIKKEIAELSKMMSDALPKTSEGKSREQKMREKASAIDNKMGGTSFIDAVNDYFQIKSFEAKNKKISAEINAKELALARAMSQKIPNNSTDVRTREQKMREQANELDLIHGVDTYSKQVDAYFNVLGDSEQKEYAAASKLAKALEGNTSDPNTQKKKALKIIADTILANDPDYVTAKNNKERVSAKDRLKAILSDKDAVSKIIEKALSIATAKVQADKNLSDSQKQAIINQMEDMVAEITELPVNKTQQRAVAGALSDEDLQAEVKRIAEQHYTDPSGEIKSYAQKLVEELDIDPAYAESLQKQVEEKIEAEVKKKLDAQKEKTEKLLEAIGSKDKNMKSVVAKAIAKGMVSNSQFEEELLKALGYRGLSLKDIATIKNLMARMEDLDAGEEIYEELSKQLNDILTEADETVGALLGRWLTEQFYINALSNFVTTALQNSLIGAFISSIQQGTSTAIYNPKRFARAMEYAKEMKANNARPGWHTVAAKWNDVTADFGETTQHDKQPTKAHSAVVRVTMKSYSDMLDDLKNAKHGRKLYYAMQMAFKTGSHIMGAGKRSRKFPAYAQISTAIMSSQDLLQGALMEDINNYIEAEKYLDVLNKERKKNGRKLIPKGTKRWNDRMRILTSTNPEKIAQFNKEVDEEARVRIANGEELTKGWKHRRMRTKMQSSLPKSVLDEAIHQGKKALFLHKPESKPGALIYKLVSDALIINDKDGGIALVKTLSTMITGFLRLSIVASELGYRTIPIIPIITKLSSGEKQRFIDGKVVGVPLTEEDIKRRIVSNLATTAVFALLLSSMFDWEDEEDEQGNKIKVMKLDPNCGIKFYGGGDDEKQRNIMKSEGAEPNSVTTGGKNIPLALLGFGIGVIGKVLGEVSNDIRFRNKPTDEVMSFDAILGVTTAQIIGAEYSPVKKALKEVYSYGGSPLEAIEVLALDGVETALSPSILEAVKKEYDAIKGIQKQKRDGISDQIFGDIVFVDYFIDKNGGKLYDHFGQPIYSEPTTPILKALLPETIWANGVSHVKNSPYYSLTKGEWFPKQYNSWTAKDWNWEENGKPRTYSDEQKEDISREMDKKTADLINSEYKALEAMKIEDRLIRLKQLRSDAIDSVKEKYSKSPSLQGFKGFKGFQTWGK